MLVCVSVCVCVFAEFLHVKPQPPVNFTALAFTPRRLFRILSARRTNVIWNLEQNSAAARTPHPPAYLLISSEPGPGSAGQGGRVTACRRSMSVHGCRNTGTPAGLTVVLLAHRHATAGRHRSQTIGSTAAPRRTPHTLKWTLRKAE